MISQINQQYKIISDLIPYSKKESKRGSRQTPQIAESLQGGKASLKIVMLRCAEEAKLRAIKVDF